MSPSKRPAVSTAFNRFLYAGVGDDKNGMELTLLSAFARQNVDPWEQAADLSRLPGEAATRALATLLGALPGQGSLLERTVRAKALLVLLPQPAEIRRSEIPRAPAGTSHRSGRTTGLAMVLIYFASMLIGAWWFGSHAPAEDVTQPVTAVVPDNPPPSLHPVHAPANGGSAAVGAANGGPGESGS